MYINKYGIYSWAKGSNYIMSTNNIGSTYNTIIDKQIKRISLINTITVQTLQTFSKYLTTLYINNIIT